METQSLKIKIVDLDDSNIEWFIETAAVNMLTDELKRPELINLDRIYSLAKKGMEDKAAFLAKHGDVYCGAIGGLLHGNLFNPDHLTLAEIFWYVLPQYRNGRAGYMLLQAFDKRASEIANDSVLSLLSSSEININGLEKRGFKMAESSFRKVY